MSHNDLSTQLEISNFKIKSIKKIHSALTATFFCFSLLDEVASASPLKNFYLKIWFYKKKKQRNLLLSSLSFSLTFKLSVGMSGNFNVLATISSNSAFMSSMSSFENSPLINSSIFYQWKNIKASNRKYSFLFLNWNLLVDALFLLEYHPLYLQFHLETSFDAAFLNLLIISQSKL